MPNPYSTHQLYKNVFEEPQVAAGESGVILAADFSDIQFVLNVSAVFLLSDVTGEFEVGEEVSGGLSGATGTVFAIDGTNLYVGNVVGTFSSPDEITGESSGATADASVTTPNFTVALFKSNQKYDNPPDPSLPSTPDNQYEQIAFTAESTMVNYSAGSEFNPNTGSPTGTPSTAQQSFRAGTQGAVWVFLKILAYTGGSLFTADIDLFNNQ